MRWFKHDSAANSDAKLKRVRIKYGMEGYGLYWYCLELIANEVSNENITFELEHDSEIISYDTGIHYERVQEMMTYMVNIGLFEEKQGVITCLKLAKRLDQSMTSNPEMRSLIDKIKKNHDGIMTKPLGVMQDKTRLDKNRYKYSDEHYAFAEAMYKSILEAIPGERKPNLKSWANTIRLMTEKDQTPLADLKRVFCWANSNQFWSLNIRSPGKLREQFARLDAESKKTPRDNVVNPFAEMEALSRAPVGRR